MLIPCVLLEVASTTLTAYGFSRFRFRERNLLFGLLIFTIIVPVQTYMIPQYVSFTHFNFFGLLAIPGAAGITLPNYTNTLIPMYIMAAFGMGIRSGLYIFIMRQFFKGLPLELEEAALIDGCGPVRTLWKVLLPNVIPAIVTVLVFSLVWYWNDYYVSSFYLTRDFPLSVSLTLLNGKLTSVGQQANISSQDLWLMRDSVLSCGCILVLLPLVVIYIFAQKQFTESIERTGLVG
jgi:multiple sugar transport system permease protein